MDDPVVDLLDVDAAAGGKNWLDIDKEFKRKQIRRAIYIKHRDRYRKEQKLQRDNEAR
jgi:hypothetical protein